MKLSLSQKIILFLPIFIFRQCTDITAPDKSGISADSGSLIMVTSDFQTGMVSLLKSGNLSVDKDLMTVYQDSIIRERENLIYILHRLGSDSLSLVDPYNSFHIIFNKKIGNGDNPQDIEQYGNLLIISLYERNYLKVLKADDGSYISQIDLQAYSDSDGVPESSVMVKVGNRLFVVLQRLNRPGGFTPINDSYLLKINLLNLQISGVYTLPFRNPVGKLRYLPARNSLLVACPGYFYNNGQLDGGLVEFELTSENFLISPLTEAQAGYEISDAVLDASGIGYAVGYALNKDSVIFQFNSNTHAVTSVLDTISTASGGYFSGLEAGSGSVYFADRRLSASGIKIYRYSDGLYVNGPIPAGLPPFSIDILDGF